MLAVVYCLCFMLVGCLLMRFFFPRQTVITRVWLGSSFGLFLMMWLPALAAFFMGFSLAAHLTALAAAVLLLLLSFYLRSGDQPRKWGPEDKRLLKILLFTALPLLIFASYLEYTHTIRPAADGLHVGQSTYGDLNLHLSIITSMRNARFPADYSIFPGARLSYPFLTDTLSTSFMILGMGLRYAALFPSVLMLLLVFCGYIILADRIFGRTGTTVLAFAFFFLNGGLGFLYSFDMLGVSQGTSGTDQMRMGIGLLERIKNILYGWYQTPTNHAEFTTYNLRWSNVICDMLIPQRTILGGWCHLLPCLYGLFEMAQKSLERAENQRYGFQWRCPVILGIWSGGLVMIHTHSFFALGIISAGWLLYTLICRREHILSRLLPWLVYGVLAVLLALPQLLIWTFGQVSSSDHFLSVHFNWVNNSGSNGLRDGYLWFYIKNIGLPFLFMIMALLEKKSLRRFLASGAFAVFIIAELFQFQPNEYDNNKLFYVWYMFGAMLAADWALDVFERLKGFRSRWLAAVLTVIVCFTSAVLTCAREAVSDYMLFSEYDVEAAEFVENNTPEHATFISWTEHINPVSALAGRDIVCGPDLWLYYHGLNTGERQADIRAFYRDPEANKQMLDKYGVDYIYIGSYERANLLIDYEGIASLFDEVFESSNGEIRIYRVNSHD